jgi:hypothetical protein
MNENMRFMLAEDSCHIRSHLDVSMSSDRL